MPRWSLAPALGLSLAAHVAVWGALRARPVALQSPEPLGLAGDTFELPAPEATSEGSPAGAEAPAGASQATPVSAVVPGGLGRPRPTAPAAPRPGPAGGNASAPEVGAGGGAALYGAVGDRSAIDLATAFTRGFPQAASADPQWAAAPLGPAGEVDVLLTLDEGGKLAASEVGPGAPAPLAAGIRRTLALVGGRAFTARGKTTRLHLVASISPDTVHDGLHGDVFAIGGSYTGSEGQAFFALAIGRRIDLKVRPR